AHAARDAMRRLAQHGVAGAVAERIVDLLEAVQVDHHYRDARIAALREKHRLAQAVVEQAAVGQAGQRVVIGEEARLLLLALAFGDVLRHADHAVGLAGAVRDGLAVRRQPGHAPVVANDAVFVRAHAGLLPGRGDGGDIPVAIFRMDDVQVFGPVRGAPRCMAFRLADQRRRIAAPVQASGVALNDRSTWLPSRRWCRVWWSNTDSPARMRRNTAKSRSLTSCTGISLNSRPSSSCGWQP